MQHNDKVNSIWKTISLVVITANLSGGVSWLLFGHDAVRHSEIDQIMATRAPYLHDKQRIDEFMAETKRRLNEIESK